ncbi:uncharacterized protein si:dkey-106l3.7 isoform X2 [Pimephales promelas]|uniref:uncharacterized protein si:dkey-106l3.7 isoform X2 n=1 Tax=Pimephales promelas TaxID=90988 RepID=UPI001955699F|nr:uncharacterized protein si:dkey-106l3.7 isoform X2 [Pimephales promelas]KAG1970763.1 hypothetical protein F2P79_002180 [Pimephales promelas]
MNLYRNFGNILENWVTGGYPDLHYKSGNGVDILDSVSRDSVPLSSVKSESEDSGFETVSTTPCHSHQCSELTSDESHPVFGSTVDHVQPSSLSPSICSSSSSCVSLSSVAPKTTCLKVEQALRRTEPASWRESLDQMERGAPGPLYRCNTASFPTNCHPTSSRPHYQFARPRRTHSQPSDPKKAELYRKILKYDQYRPPSDSQLAFTDGDQYRLDKLSPGLLYLEQVCRMLENIAKLQQQNHSLQKELDILKSQHAEKQCVSFHKEEIRYPAHQSLQILDHENPDSGPSRLKEPKGFRHRSVSDTQAAVSRRRRARFAQDEPIADILVEEPEGNDSLLENDHKKLNMIQKLKFASFRRQGTQQSDSESKSFQPKKKTKLPKIFRSRTITTRL